MRRTRGGVRQPRRAGGSGWNPRPVEVRESAADPTSKRRRVQPVIASSSVSSSGSTGFGDPRKRPHGQRSNGRTRASRRSTSSSSRQVLTQLDDDGAGAEFHERAFARAHSLLRDHWSQPLREAGVAFNVSVKEGGPAEMLLDMATRVEADLLVVGRREHYPLRGTLGGVGQRVLAYAPCPAVIIPSLP